MEEKEEKERKSGKKKEEREEKRREMEEKGRMQHFQVNFLFFVFSSLLFLRHRALVCTYVIQNRPHLLTVKEFSEKFPPKQSLHCHSAKEAIKEALQAEDEHLIKLIFVCLTDYEKYRKKKNEKGKEDEQDDAAEIFLLAPLHTIELLHYSKDGHWRFV